MIETRNLPKCVPSLPLSTVRTASSIRNSDGRASPYGDPSEWDILWLGHCGAGMPRELLARRMSSKHHTTVSSSSLVLTHLNDQTVPIGEYIKAHPFQGGPDALATVYPPHTRVYHRSNGGQLCTVGYAVSQCDARRLLHQFGVKGWNGIFDAEMERWCAGEDPDMGPNYPKAEPGGRRGRGCT